MAGIQRNKEIATIKIAQQQLGLDDDTYRAMLERLTGKRSAADLDGHGRKTVIDHLKKQGAKIGKPKGRPATFDRDPYYAKIEALLADMQLPWEYAQAIAERITGGKAGGVQRLEWVQRPTDFRNIVAALMHEKKKRVTALWAELCRALDAKKLPLSWCIQEMQKDRPRWKFAANEWNQSLADLRTLLERLK